MKNLPQNGVNELELKKHFSDIDELTDIKLKYNDFGNFRRFAFIGFKSGDAAERAICKLNNSFIGNNKIAIEACKAIREAKPDKLASVGKTKENQEENDPQSDQSTKAKKKKRSKEDPFEEVKDDPEFKEFISLQRNIGANTEAKQIWSDDVRMNSDTFDVPKKQVQIKATDGQVEAVDEQQASKKRHHRSRPKKKSTKSKPKELYVHTIKLKGFPPEVRRKDVIDFLKPIQVLSVRLNKKDGVCYASFKDERDRNFSLKKNNHFWTTYRIKMFRHDVKRSRLFKETIQEKCREKEIIKQKQQELLAKAEPIEESGRLFVRNLNYGCSQDDLEKVFSQYGEITEIHFPIDKTTSLPKGYAYVEFMFPENAKKAYDELNGTIFQGRNFHLIPSEPKPESRPNAYGRLPRQVVPSESVQRVNSTETGKQNEENLGENGQKTNEQPVEQINNTASQKRLLLGATSAEAVQPQQQIETNSKAPQIASSSSYKEDKMLKQKQTASRGSNWNILFLGQNALADVVSEARGVEKSKLLTQHSRKEPIAVRMALGDATAVEEMRRFLIGNGIELDSFDNPKAPRSRTVILVKNLPNSTKKDNLQALFERHGRVGRVIMPPNGLTAIVEMEEPVEAKLAFKKLAYSKFNDSVLYLEWAPINVFREKCLEIQNQDEAKELAKAQTGSKILVKNVPFEATQQELKKIFASFGELNFVRLPKKIDGSHRGFGFVDYLTREDALRAFKGLSHSTHLYGRRLVLEWAKTDEQQQMNDN